MSSNTEFLISIQGVLRQKMSTFRMDRYLYCIVTETDFLLFNKDDLTKLEMKIELINVKSVICLTASSRPGFNLVLKDNLTFTFFTDSQFQLQKWICALQTEPINEILTIDSFELLKVIGHGAMGKVRLAKRKNTDELFAIKSIRKEKLPNEVSQSRIRSERNALMRAKHKFVTRLYFAFQNNYKLYFVLEYVPGGDLRHHLDLKVQFSSKQIQLYLAEIIIALRSLHSIGIIYRDLKPENILIDENGHIKLADFGLAYEINDNNKASSLVGTFEYMSPEMLNKKEQTFAIDWWSLGIIAYYLIVGKFPFMSLNKARLFDMISKQNPRYPSNLPQNTISFLNSLLEKDPKKRLSFDIMNHPYFDNIEWSKVENCEYNPEFIPQILTIDSVENFDNSFTSQAPADSFVEQNLFQYNVQGFSFVENDISQVENL